MMKLRALILTALLGAALLLFQHEDSRGRFREGEQWFLDFLVANARDTFTRHLPERSSDVVAVEFREEDKAEFSAWPPAPLDYIMVLKRLAAHEPEVVAFTTPMQWGGEQAQFIHQLRDRLVSVPSVVYAFHLSTGAGSANKDETDFFSDSLPALDDSEGSEGPGLHFVAVSALPDRALRPAAHFGFSAQAASTIVPMVATDGRRLVPSVAAQALTLFRHTPYSEQRLRFGIGGRLNLGERFIVPLDDAGALHLREKFEVPTVNALDLMVPEIGDELGKHLRDLLGRGKAVVFTISAAPDGTAQARALAQSLSLTEVRRAGSPVAWGAALALCLLGFWQLRHRPLGVLVSGFVLVTGILLVSLLAFQGALLWWSPFASLTVVAVSTAFCFFFPEGAQKKPDDLSIG